MTLDARRKQKKAEKRNAKEKAKRRDLARRKLDDVGAKLRRVAAAPILHCYTTQTLWDTGIAQVLVSRELVGGQVAFAAFLVDRYCLGVKDAFCGFMARAEYFEKLHERVAATGDVVTLKPAAARKLVEGAVEYAKNLGLSPHGDYDRARNIFGDIDPAASDREFEFGKDGKPFFVAGPHDSPGRCQSIIGILSQRCGPGNFDYLMHVPAGSLEDHELLDLAQAFDNDEEEDMGDVIEGSVASASPPQSEPPPARIGHQS
jgi:hypothetical protein